jgi:hypothetical protein
VTDREALAQHCPDGIDIYYGAPFMINCMVCLGL